MRHFVKRLKKNSPGESDSFIATVDPGIDGTGISIWEDSKWRQLTDPVEVFTLYGKGLDGYQRMSYITRKYREKVHGKYRIRKVYIEFPIHMENVRGYAAARRGDVLKLACLTGSLKLASEDHGAEVVMVEVGWQGQVRKDIVEKRAESRLPGVGERLSIKSTHAWDSFALGLYVKGFYRL